MTNTRSQHIIKKVLKYIGRFLISLVVLCVCALAVLHVPAVQQYAAKEISKYLSQKTTGSITIGNMRFSILGTLAIENLEILDPSGRLLVAADEVRVETSIPKLFASEIYLNNTRLDGIDVRLEETNGTWNYTFLVDAFSSAEAKSPSEPGPIRIISNDLQLTHFNFSLFTSADSIQVGGDIVGLTDGLFSINPNQISAGQLLVNQVSVDILSTRQNGDSVPDTIVRTVNQLPYFDFGTGYAFELNEVHIDSVDFAYNIHTRELNPEVFDPEHVNLNAIQVLGSGLLLTRDLLTANVESVKAVSPGINLEEVSTSIRASLTEAEIPHLHVRTGSSEVNASATARYGSWTELPSQFDQAGISVAFTSRIMPSDVRYFLGDSIMHYFAGWPHTQFDLEAEHLEGSTDIRKLDVVAGSDRINASARIDQLFGDTEQIRWQGADVKSNIGPSLKLTISKLLGTRELPEKVSLAITSSGQADKFTFHSNAMTSWGDLQAGGQAGFGQDDLRINIEVDAQSEVIDTITGLDWLHSGDITLHASGTISQTPALEVEGTVRSIGIMDKDVRNIVVQGSVEGDSINADISILDERYRAKIITSGSYAEPYSANGLLILDSFKLGSLIATDSSLLVSGNFNIHLSQLDSFLSISTVASDFQVSGSDGSYHMDTSFVDFSTMPEETNAVVRSEDIQGRFFSNFHISEIAELLDTLVVYNFKLPATEHKHHGKEFDLDLELANIEFIRPFGLPLEHLNNVVLNAQLNDSARALTISAQTGSFAGYGMSYDNFDANINISSEDANCQLNVHKAYVDSIEIGDLSLTLHTIDSTAHSDFTIVQDSVIVFGLNSRIVRSRDGFNIYTDTIGLFDHRYYPQYRSPVYVDNHTIEFDSFEIHKDGMVFTADGDKNAFELQITNLSLQEFNYFLSSDTAVINRGSLNGILKYDRDGKVFLCDIQVDSLKLYDAPSVQIRAEAQSSGSQVPYSFEMTSQSNSIISTGEYDWQNELLDASIDLDLREIGAFQYLVSGILDTLNGQVVGSGTIAGSLDDLKYNAAIELDNVRLVTAETGSRFNIDGQSLNFDQSGISFNDFTITDQTGNPLVINGVVINHDYSSFEYDLKLHTDNYVLVNNPRTDEYGLQGILALASDIEIKGDAGNTYLDAVFEVNDTTDLTFVMPKKEIELMTSEGIVDFVDPTLPDDSLTSATARTYYDSIIASLPELTLNSRVIVDDNAVFTLLIDPLSGDYIETRGSANLDFKFDRTGNIQLNGNYEVQQGFYQLSFYNIAKKKFEITDGSMIQWSGIPEDGVLDITARHIVRTSSTGLLGDEISDNEKSLYRRALPYEVSIIIQGTIQEPEVSFGLDLPDEDKLNYPALGNKLSRLSQPEYESELNKQVFGLLVLGGFIPQTTGSDFDEMAVATTAIANSVNSLLAAQLNRLTNQIEAVDINIGLQSYSDYTSGTGSSGRTKTAMDFRVSKSLLDDRLSFEVGAEVDINSSQSGSNTGTDNFRGDITVTYDLTESGNKKLKAFNNETYDIIYHEIRNTGIALIFIREFDKGEKRKSRDDK